MNTRDKGRLLEQYLCDQLRKKGIDIKAKPAFNSGATNTEKSDIWTSAMILGQNAGFECKNSATFCIPEWWKQTKKLESLGREPVLVFKHVLEPLGETKVVLYLDSLLELMRNQK